MEYQTFLDTLVTRFGNINTKFYDYEHNIADGIYLRKLNMRKGVLMGGVTHLRETTLIVLKGSIKLISDKGISLLNTGAMVFSEPGSNRLAYAIEESSIVTIHRIDTLDLEEFVSEYAKEDVKAISGVNEGTYKLFNKGTKVLHAKIHSTGTPVLPVRNIQRLPSY